MKAIQNIAMSNKLQNLKGNFGGSSTKNHPQAIPSPRMSSAQATSLSFRDFSQPKQRQRMHSQQSNYAGDSRNHQTIPSSSFSSTKQGFQAKLQEKKRIIKAEIGEIKEVKSMQKKLKLMKKLQIEQKRILNRTLLEQMREQNVDELVPETGTQKEALASLNYTIDQDFDKKLKQQGYLEVKRKSNYQNDYTQFECFESQFGSNRFKLATDGSVICLKKKPENDWKKYFQNREKQQSRIKTFYETSEVAQYLRHGLSRQDQLPKAGRSACSSVKPQRPATQLAFIPETVQLPLLNPSSQDNFEKSSIEDGAGDDDTAFDGFRGYTTNYDTLHIAQQDFSTSQNHLYKSKSKTRCQKRRQRLLLEAQQPGTEKMSSTFFGLNKNSQLTIDNFNKNIKIKPIDLSVLNLDQGNKTDSVQQRKANQKMTSFNETPFKEPQIYSSSFGKVHYQDTSENRSASHFDCFGHKNQIKRKTFQEITAEEEDEMSVTVPRDLNQKQNETVDQPQYRQSPRDTFGNSTSRRSFSMIEDLQCRNAIISGYTSKLSSKGQSHTHRMPNTGVTYGSSAQCFPNDNQPSQPSPMQNALQAALSSQKIHISSTPNDIFTGGLSLVGDQSIKKLDKAKHTGIGPISKQLGPQGINPMSSKRLHTISGNNTKIRSPQMEKNSQNEQISQKKISQFQHSRNKQLYSSRKRTGSSTKKATQELEVLRQTSRSNLVVSGDPLHRDHYIQFKIDQIQSMVSQNRISREDLKDTLEKYRIGRAAESIGSQNQNKEDNEMAPIVDNVNVNGQNILPSLVQSKVLLKQIHVPSSRNFEAPAQNIVEQNTKNIAKKTHLKKINVFCKNVSTDKVIRQIKAQRQRELSPAFLQQKYKIGKWDEFREKRLDVIKKYIHTKRKLTLTRLILIHVILVKFFFGSKKWIQIVKQLRKEQYFRVFIGLRIVLRFKSHWRRRYGDPDGLTRLTRNRLRYALMFFQSFATSSNQAMAELARRGRVQSMKQSIKFAEKRRRNSLVKSQDSGGDDSQNIPVHSRRSSTIITKKTSTNDMLKNKQSPRVQKAVIKQKFSPLMLPYTLFYKFLFDQSFHWNNQNLLKRVNRTMELIIKMQRKVRSNIEIRQTRIYLIMMMQDKLMGKIYQNIQAKKTFGAQKMLELITKFLQVDPNVKHSLATAYLDRCMANYMIALSQWRLFFREKQCRHNLNQENLSVEQEARDVYYSIQKHYHTIQMRKKMMEIIVKQPSISQKTLYHELLLEEDTKDKKEGESKRGSKKATVQGQTPFEILQTLPHHIHSFQQLQWPEPTTKAEQESDKKYTKEFKRYKKQQKQMTQEEEPYSPASPFKKRMDDEEYVPNADLSPLSASGISITRPTILAQIDALEVATPMMPFYDFGKSLNITKLKSYLSPPQLNSPKAFNLHEMLSQSEIDALVYPTYKYHPDAPPSLIYWPTRTMLFRLARAAHAGAIITRVAGSQGGAGKKKGKVDILRQSQTKEVILNINVGGKKKKKGASSNRMFYDPSLWADVMTYIRPENLEKSIPEMEENIKLKTKINKILAKNNKKVPKKEKRASILIQESLGGVDPENASLFDIQSPDRLGDDDDDDDESQQRLKIDLEGDSENGESPYNVKEFDEDLDRDDDMNGSEQQSPGIEGGMSGFYGMDIEEDDGSQGMGGSNSEDTD